MSARRSLLHQPDRRQQAGRAPEPRRRASSASPEPLTQLAPDDDLPPHEPLQLPLSDMAVRKISELCNRTTALRAYDTHLKKSGELLCEAVGSINEAYSERDIQLRQTVERRRERGRSDQPSRGEEALQTTVANLSEHVDTLTRQMEARARTVIDLQVGLEDERQALQATAVEIVAQQEEDRRRRRQEAQAGGVPLSMRARRKRRRRGGAEGDDGGSTPARAKSEGDDDGDDGGGGSGAAGGRPGGEGNGEEEEGEGDDDDDDDDAGDEEEKGPPPVSAFDLLRQARAAHADKYAQMTAHQKYALNNDYITFKQTMHYAMFLDDDVAIPDASVWFDANGEPVIPSRANAGEAGADNDNDGGNGAAAAAATPAAAAGGNDDDDDLIVAREVTSFKCPLTLKTMAEPYKSRVCKHVFEKAAILEYLQNGPLRCPQTGCDKTLSHLQVVPDEVMRRRIQRAEQQEQRRNEAVATSDIEGDDGSDAIEDVDDVVVGRSQAEALAARKRESSRAESVARSVKRERFHQRML